MKPYEFVLTGVPHHNCILPPVQDFPAGTMIRCTHVAVIEGQEKLIGALEKRKTSPWKRLGDVLIGVAAGVVLR